MKDTVGRLIVVHLVVLGLVALGSAIIWGLSASGAAVVGALAFTLPVILFSVLVLRASAGVAGRFWGRFMVAELMKWVVSAALLAGAFASGLFPGKAQPLLAGFLLSVLVQVFFPIFVRKESES